MFVEPLRYKMLFTLVRRPVAVRYSPGNVTFTENRPRLIDGAVTGRSLAAAVDQARQRRVLSKQHFGVDGTLIHAWASMGSHRRKQDRAHAGTNIHRQGPTPTPIA